MENETSIYNSLKPYRTKILIYTNTMLKAKRVVQSGYFIQADKLSIMFYSDIKQVIKIIERKNIAEVDIRGELSENLSNELRDAILKKQQFFENENDRLIYENSALARGDNSA